MALSKAASSLLKWLRMYKIDPQTLEGRRAGTIAQPNKSWINSSNYGAKARTATSYKGGMKAAMAELITAAPTLSSFTPTSAAGNGSGGTQQVVITGTKFTGATAVSFGGVAAHSFVVDSATQITAQVKAGSKSGDVRVVTPEGAISKSGFTFLPLPVITSFAPTTAAVGGSVVITGKNFTGTTGATGVKFNGVNATSYVVNSATQITAVVPSGSTGAVSVTNTGGTATKTGFTVTA